MPVIARIPRPVREDAPDPDHWPDRAEYESFFLDAWPSKLHNLSIPSVKVPISGDEAEALGSLIINLGHLFNPVDREKHLAIVRSRLHHTFRKRCRDGAMFRFGSGAPKPGLSTVSPAGLFSPRERLRVPPLHCFGANDVLRAIQYPSAFTADALMYAARTGGGSIWLRKVLDIPRTFEFRVFLVPDADGALFIGGVTQYWTMSYLDDIQKRLWVVQRSIWAWVEKNIRDFRHFSRGVAMDVFVNPWDHKVVLIDTNPVCRGLTDFGLFSGPPRDGSFRFRVREVPRRVISSLPVSSREFRLF